MCWGEAWGLCCDPLLYSLHVWQWWVTAQPHREPGRWLWAREFGVLYVRSLIWLDLPNLVCMGFSHQWGCPTLYSALFLTAWVCNGSCSTTAAAVEVDSGVHPRRQLSRGSAGLSHGWRGPCLGVKRCPSGSRHPDPYPISWMRGLCPWISTTIPCVPLSFQRHVATVLLRFARVVA